MVGRTRSIRPKVPRASGSPPRHVLQFFVLAGQEVFPARRLEAWAAERPPKGKEVRVFSKALDESKGVGMSRAEVSRDPSWVLIRNFLVPNHCTPPSVRFVFGIAIPGAFGSLGRPSPKHKPGKTTGGYVLGQIHSVAWCGVTKQYESYRSAYGGHEIELDVSQIDIGPTPGLLELHRCRNGGRG
jgi:hypothetical protein